MNKVILIGNLGAKPELKYLPSGQAVCEFRIATSEKWTKDGQTHEKTEWHRIVVWGKTGENCAQYLDKGRPVAVEGKLQTRSWDDKETGQKKYMTEIVASFVKFLGGGNGGGKKSEGGDTGGEGGDFPPTSGDDDIPF